MVALLRASIHTLHEDVVKLLIKGDLSMLKLGKSIDHDSVVEVFSDHSLKQGQIICRELADTLIKGVCNLGIRLNPLFDYILNVSFTLLHIEA